MLLTAIQSSQVTQKLTAAFLIRITRHT